MTNKNKKTKQKIFQELKKDLKSQNWKTTNNAEGNSIIIPLKNKLQKYALKITKNLNKKDRKYSYSILNNSNVQIGAKVSYDEFINQSKPVRDSKLYEILKNEISIKKSEFSNEFQKIINNINENNIHNLLKENHSILEKNLQELENKKTKQKNKILRQNKLYPHYNKEKTKEFEEILENNYDIDILDYIWDKSQYLILNENKNVSFLFLASMSVILGLNGLLIEVHGMSDSGKSYMVETVLNHFIPKEYQYDVNDITEASFLDKGKYNPYFFDRMIIYLGDLGDKEKYDKIKPIFNILKIQITEKNYSKEKKGGKNYEDDIRIEIKGHVGAVFCTVDKEDRNSQMDSRTLNVTPANNYKNSKLGFQLLVDTKGNDKYNKFKETIEELKMFKEYLKSIICEINANNKIQVLNPFLNSLINITKNKETETRQTTYLGNMFKVYLLLNYANCIEIKSENLTYLVPKLEHINKFIELVFNNAGLKPYEKNLILKLKDETNPITSKNAEKLFNDKCEEYDSKLDLYGNVHLERIDERNKRAVEDLINENGLRTDRKMGKNLNNKPINNVHFFTSNTVKRIFKSHKSIKDIEDLEKVFNNLKERGFLEKLPEKYRRKNVFYLNKNEVEGVEEDYKISKEDLKNAQICLNKFKVGIIHVEKIMDIWKSEYGNLKK